MKAVIRGEGETITQDMKIDGINWDTGEPLTNRDWCGGPYTLVNNYSAEDAPEASQDPVVEEAAPDTIVIDGVTYTRTS